MDARDASAPPSTTRAIVRLWTRARPGEAPVERSSLRLVAGRGVAGDHAFGGTRHVTLVFEDDWNAAARALGRDVDPVGRRANVLLGGGGGRHLVGRTVRLGEARLAVRGVTAPCEVMDRAAPGMRDALEPDGRAGVWAVVLAGGTLRAGDVLHVEPAPGD
jgi:MOSC domain-containing protein YiiM